MTLEEKNTKDIGEKRTLVRNGHWRQRTTWTLRTLEKMDTIAKGH
jgi:hypothetical protein